MKQLSFLILLFISTFAFSQNPAAFSDKMAVYCKVWGFLKYHHPAVARGKYDWDGEFIKNLKRIETIKGKDKINQFYYT